MPEVATVAESGKAIGLGSFDITPGSACSARRRCHRRDAEAEQGLRRRVATPELKARLSTLMAETWRRRRNSSAPS